MIDPTFKFRGTTNNKLFVEVDPSDIDMKQINFTATISQTIGSTVEVDNVEGGFASIAFHLIVPTGGEVTFRGSFDGTTFTDIKFRQIENDGYIKSTTLTDNYIGSISGLRTIQFLTSVGGSADGRAMIYYVTQDNNMVTPLSFCLMGLEMLILVGVLKV